MKYHYKPNSSLPEWLKLERLTDQMAKGIQQLKLSFSVGVDIKGCS